jgi:hypothetical protein
MDPNAAYAALRQSLSDLDERVAARYWDEQAPVRVSYRRLLSSLDQLAGRLLGEPAEPPPPVAVAALVEVAFTLPAEVRADSVELCGDFTGWSANAIPLDRDSDGSWRTTVALEPGRSYRFRYLLDGERWENAWQADEYLPNDFGGTDSVIVVKPGSSQ